MIQRHSIILWRRSDNKDKSFEVISREIYETLDLFQDCPMELRPNYLTSTSKKDIKEFDWNLQNFIEALKKGVNKEGDIVFEDLGYSISFFSSINEQESCVFELIAGNKSEKFYNTLIINLPLSLDIFKEETAKKVSGLFEKLVESYEPFWGCISNKALSRKYGKFLEGNLPTTVHWINYWSEDIIHVLKMERIQEVVEKNPTVTFKNGILLIRDMALDINKESDMRFHGKLHKELFEGVK